MNSKWILSAGIVLLIIGIIIKKTTGLAAEGLVMIVTGVLFKTYYIISKARSGEYQPGKELLFLFFGLVLFLSGIYFRSMPHFIYAPVMIISGLALKVVFIILFILKSRSKTKELISK